MDRMSVTEARRNLSRMLHRVASGEERIILERRGEGVAALVPVEDLRLLGELEDRLDAEEALRRLRDPKDKAVPYKRARRGLGLR